MKRYLARSISQLRRGWWSHEIDLGCIHTVLDNGDCLRTLAVCHSEPLIYRRAGASAPFDVDKQPARHSSPHHHTTTPPTNSMTKIYAPKKEYFLQFHHTLGEGHDFTYILRRCIIFTKSETALTYSMIHHSIFKLVVIIKKKWNVWVTALQVG